MISSKYPLFLKFLIAIYIFLTTCSLFYISSINNLINISLLYKQLFSIGYGYWIAISFIIVQIGIGRILFRLPFLRNIKLSGLAYLMFCLGGGFYVSYYILMILALFIIQIPHILEIRDYYEYCIYSSSAYAYPICQTRLVLQV